MTSSFQLGTPVNHRLTGFAVGSTLIAIGDTGCLHLFQGGQFCVMIMPGIDSIIDLGRNIHAATEGDITVSSLRVAEEDAGSHINNGAVTGLELFLGSDGLASDMIDAIPRPQTDRQTYQSLFTGQGAVIGSGDHKCHDIFNRVDVGGGTIGNDLAVSIQQDIFHFVAGCHDHMLQLPLICGVQLDIGFHIIDGFRRRSLDIKIVDRVVLGHFSGVVVSIQVNDTLFGIYLNGKGSGLLIEITQVIRDFEGNRMGTVR